MEILRKEFYEERILISNFRVKEVKGDGACLYRCLSNCIFNGSLKNLKEIKSKFISTGYFNNKKFLSDYMDIYKCFTGDDYELDDDLEEDIARGLQLLILNYVKKNRKKKILMEMTLEELILLCHEIDYETYIGNYERFAGEEDEEINRWGGIPEIRVFCILFDYEISIYTPQKFNEKKMKIMNVTKIRDDTYLKLIDKIGSDGDKSIKFNMMLRYFNEGSHYDFLENNKN